MKQFAFFLILFNVLINANGQILNKMRSSEQEFLRFTTDSALLIVRQDYILITTDSVSPKEFGSDGRTWFGRGYALGVVVDGAIIIPSILLKPWVFDAPYIPFQQVDTLKPKATDLSVRHFDQAVFTTITQRADTLCWPDSSASAAIVHNAMPVLPVDFQTTDTSGWLVLAYADSLTGTVTLKRFQVGWMDAKNNTIRPPEDPARLLGGVYLTLKFTTGNMQVQAAGFVVKKLFNWMIEKIEPTKVPVSKEVEPLKTTGPVNLTPVETKEE